jgi:O-acetyl-ADP-ribose deacetylase (regulator of RNase III)
MPAMFEWRRGSIFESEAQFLVNTVNCEGVMGKGIALGFKQRYPDMFREYKKWCRLGHVKIGGVTEYRIPGGNRSILNFPTKDRWRLPSRYEYVSCGLDYLGEYILSHSQFTPGETRVALPAIGCGNGGLNWKVVSPMIVDKLTPVEAIFEVYQPNYLP